MKFNITEDELRKILGLSDAEKPKKSIFRRFLDWWK